MPSWFGKPPDVDQFNLDRLRDREVAELRGFRSYEKESHYTPRWVCPCGRENACAQTTCDGCGDNRPPILHGDKDQGDEILGLARMVARGELTAVSQIPGSYYEHARKWRSEGGKKLSGYAFDTERKGDPNRYVGWKAYIDFLLGGGTV